MVFPVIALLTVALKEISKPISSLVKTYAKSSPLFRKYVCLPPAKVYHSIEQRLIKTTKVKSLEEEEKQFVEMGANILGELTILAIVSSTGLFHYLKYSTNKKEKEEAKIEKMNNVKDVVVDLHANIADLRQEVLELKDIISSVKKK